MAVQRLRLLSSQTVSMLVLWLRNHDHALSCMLLAEAAEVSTMAS